MIGTSTALAAAGLVLLALAIDTAVGDPDPVWRRWPHPVVLFGRLIDAGDRALNCESDPPRRRRLAGVMLILALTVLAASTGWAIHAALAQPTFGWVVEAAIASVLLAQNSLIRHVRRVADALAAEGLEGGRKAVAMIVGRDPETLDDAGVARAAIESAAENWSDGVIAPAFWLALCGLPGIFVYKMVNTADSMIGHRSARHLAFGWASARLDDLLNLIPARLSGLLIALAAIAVRRRDGGFRQSLRAMWRDARHHRSPNAGWPEAAMAGALGLALAGPRIYASGVVQDPWMNRDGQPHANRRDILSALSVIRVSGVLAASVLAGIAALTSAAG